MSNVPRSHSDGEDGIPSYLNRLTQAPLLTAGEEIALTRAVQAGDARAKQKLVEANMRLVINIAKGYRNRSIALEDLIQEGAIGLMQAAERYDPDKGFRFSTYATHWIRQSIGRAIDSKAKSIRLPAHVSQSLRKVERLKAELSRDLGREASLDDVAAAMGISVKKLNALTQVAQEILSLDLPVGDGSGTTLGGILRDTSAITPEENVIDQETFTELNRILNELSDREQVVMRLRYNVDRDDSELASHEAAAAEMKLSRERIRQIEVQAIKKLRIIAQRRRLKDTLGR